ncbi:gamma-glutamyl-gamma-aminobutyrate hydrolase family protein [Pseudoroseomonas cervicalis]|uniref:glutamine amidotransferase-related protein n=1 Tax=Teichococcus cervicalis TaxID=204525 RepID=UPI0035ECE7E1
MRTASSTPWPTMSAPRERRCARCAPSWPAPRWPRARRRISCCSPPGPGKPSDFAMSETIDLLLKRGLPAFGVCLGLQGLVEHFGGALDVLAQPMHGKPSLIRRTGGRLLADLPEAFTVGRYHSLHARRVALPEALLATAETEDGVIMAVEHRSLPLAAVQFHPESLMTDPGRIGMPLIEAALRRLRASVTA